MTAESDDPVLAAARAWVVEALGYAFGTYLCDETINKSDGLDVRLAAFAHQQRAAFARELALRWDGNNDSFVSDWLRRRAEEEEGR